MSYNPLQPILHPVASINAIVQIGTVRFTIITERLIRIEHDPQGNFEDQASQAIWYRNQPVPTYQLHETDEELIIGTAYLRLTYKKGGDSLTSQNLTIHVKETNTDWHFGDRDYSNLLGTGRTLDEADGEIRLEPGLISRKGWAVLDDSQSLVFNENGWIVARDSVAGRSPEIVDIYFFGYGNDYLSCIQEYCKIAGKVPLLPRWVLGNWWSRFWAFSAESLIGLMNEFTQRDVPLSVCIIDMDWHITDTGNASSGWTGYTWNNDLFPDPEALIPWLHENQLKTALNLHPADGIHPHEEDYEEMAAAMDIDPASEQPVAFDIADPEFAKHYFSILHHPKEEKEGIDFWWMDWQQGVRVKDSKHPDSKFIDPLWWLNHLHFYDLQRDGQKRGFIFSRWGGFGNHRYPIGFSGDTVVSWETLAFQPYFTATASNVAYSWWSHDIGGHMGGKESGELYTRWVQFGVFSPIFRLHCTKNPYQDRTPWSFGKEVETIVSDYMRLRHRLIPYIYSMSWRNHQHDIPFILPMYYHDPDREEAYYARNQYYFGSELMVSPYVSPKDKDTNLASTTIWLPPGTWFDYFSGQKFDGNRHITVYGNLSEIPVFAPAGAIIPKDKQDGWGAGLQNPTALEIDVFIGESNSFEFFEDDGDSIAYQQGAYAVTTLTQDFDEDTFTFKIAPPSGDISVLPARRNLTINIFGVNDQFTTSVLVNDKPIPARFTYDPHKEMLSINSIECSPKDSVSLISEVTGKLSTSDRRIELLKEFLKEAYMDSWIKVGIDTQLANILANPEMINMAGNMLTASQMKAIKDILEY
jgi:alpha-glucosidase (family GH31 glycosyl hydrolase)